MIERYKNHGGETWQVMNASPNSIYLKRILENGAAAGTDTIHPPSYGEKIFCDATTDNINSKSARIFVAQNMPQNIQRYWIRRLKNSFLLSTHGKQIEIQIAEWQDSANTRDKALQALRLTMPGKVVEIKVAVGDIVEKGQCLLVVEAMKMENNLVALGRAKVEKILVEKGARLESGATLITFTAP